MTGEPPRKGPEQPSLKLVPPSKPRRIGQAARGTGKDRRIGQTLRLFPDAWEQLKVLAAQERVNSHDLLIEAVNMLFKDRGRPPIA